ncbi:MAG TPA: RNA-binding domain-containing protein [Chloroflexota bacterium]|nr:RNA-binding domain-containing protein [Chloroflexota bacterium]
MAPQAAVSVLFSGKGPDELFNLLRQQLVRVRFRASDFAGRNWRNPLYQTTYLALRHAGAKDWRTGLTIALTHSGQYHYIQTHHIFPQSVLKQAGYEPAEINEVANLAFISGGSNRTFGNKPPEIYLPPIRAARGDHALAAQGIPIEPELWKVENFKEFIEARRRLLAEAVNTFLNDASSERGSGAADVASLISSGEGDRLEFKETARLNVRTGQVDREMQKAVVKTTAGFLNGQGGTLVVGVDDAGIPVGLERDFSTLGKRQDVDGYEQFLRDQLNNSIGKDRCALVSIGFPEVDGVRVCEIRAPRSEKPVYVSDGAERQFYVRSGNTTQPLNVQAAHEYCAEHFR